LSSKSLKIALLLFLAAVLVRLAEFFFLLGDVSFYVYLLLVLIAIFQGLKDSYNTKPELIFAPLFKDAMKPAALLVVMIGVFQYIYFTQIDTSYFDLKIAERLYEAEQNGYTKEEVFALQKNLKQFMNPAIVGTFQVFALLMISVFYGIVTTLLFVKIKVFRSI
jgi:hypothetical protein